MHDGALVAFIPNRRPVFDGVVPDRDDQVSRSKNLIRRLIVNLTDPPTKTAEKFHRDCPGGLERSDHW
jgi:hypothetical protein